MPQLKGVNDAAEKPTSKRIIKWYDVVPNVIAKVRTVPFPVCIYKATQKIVIAVAMNAVCFILFAIQSPFC